MDLFGIIMFLVFEIWNKSFYSLNLKKVHSNNSNVGKYGFRSRTLNLKN